jgi:hypothetical protein
MRDAYIRPEADDDVLDMHRRALPRWVVIALWVGLVASVAAAAVAIGRASTHRHRAVATSGAASTPPLKSLLTADGADLQVAGNSLFELVQGGLYRLDLNGTDLEPAGVATISGLDHTQPNASYHLVLDPAHRRAWVVMFGAAPAIVIEFDTQTLAEVGRQLWPSEVHAAAVLDGHLYLAATNAVVDITAGKIAGTNVTALHGQYLGIVADPARARLLLLDADGALRIATYTPADEKAQSGPAAPFGKGDLVVTSDGIWAGGFSAKGAVLARLDPTTLLPVVFSELSPQLGPGAILVAAGERVLWVRAGSGLDGLWCVDSTSGNQLQYWQFEGAVASRLGLAYITAVDGPQRLQLTGCTG